MRRTGFALVLALAATAFLAVAGLELAREARLSGDLAGNFEARTRARMAAWDGLNRAASVLMADDPAYDAPTDDWAKLSTEAADGAEKLETVRLEVIDLGGLLNLANLGPGGGGSAANAGAWQGVLERLIAGQGGDPGLVQAVLDWLDADSVTRSGGAEEEEYLRDRGDIKPRNGKFLGSGELGLIKGFKASLLTGDEEHPGLSGLVTVHGQTVVNINTAPPEVLAALDDDVSEVLVEEIVSRRETEPFKHINSLKSLMGMDEELFERIRPLIGVASSRFGVRATGISGRAEQAIAVVFNRTSAGGLEVKAAGVAR